LDFMVGLQISRNGRAGAQEATVRHASIISEHFGMFSSEVTGERPRLTSAPGASAFGTSSWRSGVVRPATTIAAPDRACHESGLQSEAVW
jgi:hypothetical protein